MDDSASVTPNARERAQILLSLYYAVCLWLLELVCLRRAGATLLPCFTLSEAELLAQGFHLGELLSRLIANDPNHPLVRLTESFDYLTFDEQVLTATPGMDIDGTQVVRLRLKPEPERLPCADFFHALDQTCHELGTKRQRVLFRHENNTFESPDRFLSYLTYSGCDFAALRQSLHNWLIVICAQLENNISGYGDQPASSPAGPHPILVSDQEFEKLAVPDNIPQMEVSDSRLKRFVTGPFLAKLLGVTIRSIERWNKKGKAQRGFPWPNPTRISGNLVLYYFPDYLPALQYLLGRTRNSWIDRQLAQEILEMKRRNPE